VRVDLLVIAAATIEHGFFFQISHLVVAPVVQRIVPIGKLTSLFRRLVVHIFSGSGVYMRNGALRQEEHQHHQRQRSFHRHGHHFPKKEKNDGPTSLFTVRESLPAA